MENDYDTLLMESKEIYFSLDFVVCPALGNKAIYWSLIKEIQPGYYIKIVVRRIDDHRTNFISIMDYRKQK